MDAKLVVSDYHTMGYVRLGGVSEDVKHTPDTIKKVCADGGVYSHNFAYFTQLLDAVGSHYLRHIANDTQSNDTVKAGTGDREFSITRDEFYEFQRSSPSFNPSFLWYVKTGQDAFPFMKMWEPDHYLKMELPLKILMANSDLAPKFRSLIQQLVAPKVYFKLDEAIKQQINYFKDSNIFNKLKVRFWISGLTKSLSQLSP